LAEIRGFCGVANATAKIRAVGHDPLTLPVLSGATKEDLDMTSTTDNSFPYVLVCSTLGTIISLASVWIATVQSFAPGLVA
jgi:hypothetical protein